MRKCEKSDCDSWAILTADKSQPSRYIKQVLQRGEPSFTIGWPVKDTRFCYLHSKESAIKEADEFRERRREEYCRMQAEIARKWR